jgi:hypothetical protein
MVPGYVGAGARKESSMMHAGTGYRLLFIMLVVSMTGGIAILLRAVLDPTETDKGKLVCMLLILILSLIFSMTVVLRTIPDGCG